MDYVEAIQAFVPGCQQEAQDKQLILDYIGLCPGTILTRKNKIAHITSSGFVVNRALTKTLMVHHNIYGTWAWTGGHADGDRDLLAVALREAQEETGAVGIVPLSAEILSLDVLPVWGHVKRGAYVSAHLHLSAAYVLVADEDTPLRVRPAENSGVAWIDLDKLEEASREPEILPVYRKLLARAEELGAVRQA